MARPAPLVAPATRATLPDNCLLAGVGSDMESPCLRSFFVEERLAVLGQAVSKSTFTNVLYRPPPTASVRPGGGPGQTGARFDAKRLDRPHGQGVVPWVWRDQGRSG